MGNWDTLSWFRATGLSLECCVLSGEATNDNFIALGLTLPRFDPMIYHTRGKLINCYTIDEVRYCSNFDVVWYIGSKLFAVSSFSIWPAVFYDNFNKLGEEGWLYVVVNTRFLILFLFLYWSAIFLFTFLVVVTQRFPRKMMFDASLLPFVLSELMFNKFYVICIVYVCLWSTRFRCRLMFVFFKSNTTGVTRLRNGNW